MIPHHFMMMTLHNNKIANVTFIISRHCSGLYAFYFFHLLNSFRHYHFPYSIAEETKLD